MDMFKKGLYYSPADDKPEGDKPTGDEKPAAKPVKAEELKWETWHDALPEPAKKLVSDHVSGLKTALASERDARGTAEEDLRKVAADLEKGSDAQKKVLKLADEVAAGNTKADFYEDAHKAGVSNLKLAFHVATNEDLFDKRGIVDFEKLKKDYPELFGKKKVPDGSAGDGTGSGLPKGSEGMNEYIRNSDELGLKLTKTDKQIKKTIDLLKK